MAQITSVKTEQAVEATQGAWVYVANMRTRTYQHRAHRIARLNASGSVETYCRIVTIAGLIAVESEDIFNWCDHGCRPIPQEG